MHIYIYTYAHIHIHICIYTYAHTCAYTHHTTTHMDARASQCQTKVSGSHICKWSCLRCPARQALGRKVDATCMDAPCNQVDVDKEPCSNSSHGLTTRISFGWGPRSPGKLNTGKTWHFLWAPNLYGPVGCFYKLRLICSGSPCNERPSVSGQI